MKDVALLLLLLTYVAATAFLESGFGGRIVPADILLVGIMLIAFSASLMRRKLFFSAVHLYTLPLLVVFLIGAILSSEPGKSSFELLVIFFCFIGSIAIADILINMQEEWIKRFLHGYVIVVGLLATVCLIDFLLLPGLVSSRALGGLQGPFRNTGQAGSFFGVHAAICIAMVFSGMVSRRPVYLICVVATCLALLFTFKRAATVGLLIGLALLVAQLYFSTSKRDKKIAIYFTMASLLLAFFGSVLFAWALEYVPSMRWRFETKYSSEVIEGVSESFIGNNIRNALIAFSDSPIYGVGLGGVAGVYQSHEIHSTYFGVIAYGGVLGVISYSIFMLVFTKKISEGGKIKFDNSYALFLYYIFPMYVGLLISWAYTPHWRKREFWLLLVFVVVFSLLAKRVSSLKNAKGPAN